MGILDRVKATVGAATPKGRKSKGTGGTTERNVGGRVAGLRGRKGRRGRPGGPEDPAPGGGEDERNVGG
jgi:hypothetical protein